MQQMKKVNRAKQEQCKCKQFWCFHCQELLSLETWTKGVCDIYTLKQPVPLMPWVHLEREERVFSLAWVLFFYHQILSYLEQGRKSAKVTREHAFLDVVFDRLLRVQIRTLLCSCSWQAHHRVQITTSLCSCSWQAYLCEIRFGTGEVLQLNMRCSSPREKLDHAAVQGRCISRAAGGRATHGCLCLRQGCGAVLDTMPATPSYRTCQPCRQCMRKGYQGSIGSLSMFASTQKQCIMDIICICVLLC